MANEQTKHTPGRLHCHNEQLDASYTGADGRAHHHTIAIANPVEIDAVRYGDEGSAEANAARLALCWNAHDTLLAACERVRDELGIAIHTSMRKASGSYQAIVAWDAISRLSNQEWGAIVDFALNGLGIRAALALAEEGGQ